MSITKLILEDKFIDAETMLFNLLESQSNIEKEFINEATKVKMVRNGKRIKRLPAKKGYKIVGDKYVRMSASEKLIRKKSAKRAARTRKSKSNASAIRKRQRSIRKRG